MRELIVILDAAHGSNVPGKCSPDNTHKEYIWSRNTVRLLKRKLQKLGFEVFETVKGSLEPGLSVRKKVAENVRGSKKLLLSLHNNAAGSDGDWHNASGFEVWTTPGITGSDTCADYIINQLKKDFPKIPCRVKENKYLNKDKEENFTVLTGKGYMAVLVEWLFQDNREDVDLLQNNKTNEDFVSSICKSIVSIDSHFMQS